MRGGRGLAARVFAAQTMIVLAGAATLVVTATLVAPGLFHTHLRRAVGEVTPSMSTHLDRAFETATVLSLAAAVTASLITTTAVSWFLTRRLTRPIGELADAAERIANGAYETSVPASRLGEEFGRLDAAFNAMAASLASTEQARRALLADLAHELRTPIATLEAFVDGVEDGVLPASPETWSTMRDQIARVGRLVTDLSAVSEAEERGLGEAAAVDLERCCAEAVAAVGPRALAAEVSVRLEVESGTPGAGALTVRGDADRLREVLDNLLANALRHTPAGGEVRLELGRSGPVAIIEVADDGAGIDPVDLPRIFDRFYRGDSARTGGEGGTGSGSGLGLTIVRALVLAHGGTVTAWSDGPGRGARFTVRLPLASERGGGDER